jgi:hypothetical protein
MKKNFNKNFLLDMFDFCTNNITDQNINKVGWSLHHTNCNAAHVTDKRLNSGYLRTA